MIDFGLRSRAAFKAAFIHFCFSFVVAGIISILVFGVWYPYPYRELAGGREIFVILIVVDIVCGPMLTCVLFNPMKPRAKFWQDLTLILLIQMAALTYGVFALWQVRPLFLVHEIDRFKVIAANDVESAALAELPKGLATQFLRGPVVVGIRAPSPNERELILRETLMGGRDYAERPEFYVPYDESNALKSLKRAKPLAFFLAKQTDQQGDAIKLAKKKDAEISHWMYVPVVARQDWVAVVDKHGQIQGFLKGDGY